ncbi:hypothetical protein [Kribbella sp.]|uniref:hypothetical protein n=1 Tax=Kribbella sp. TaxID=1871183 RepID=UPI002D3EC1C6|nr:hypothetical protein [Kribbella sp.]HZX04620.1 hypothetical protein [Kribbella sp.]
MNDLLKETLAERAGSIEPPPLDLDAIIAAGNRRSSRRRALTIFGGTAVTLAGGGLAVAASRKHHVPPPVPTPFVERRPTYAVGSAIHYGSDVISVAPHKVNAFVQTDTAFVFLNQKNDIHVVDRSGVRALGKGAWSLTGGYGGTLVAWAEGFNDHYDSVVYDVAARRELVRTDVGNQIPPNASLAYGPEIVALDGNQAYFGTLEGLYRWDLTTNRGERLARVSPVAVRAVTAGLFVYQVPLDQPGTGTRLTIAKTVNPSAAAEFVGGEQAFLSPTTKYLVTQPADARPGNQKLRAELHLFDTASRRSVALPDRYRSKFFGQWLDGTTCTIAAELRSGDLDLLVVDARTGTAEVAVPKFTKLTFSKTPAYIASFALPTGRPVVDLA